MNLEVTIQKRVDISMLKERYDNFDDLKHHIFEVWFFPKKKSGELLKMEYGPLKNYIKILH